MYKAMTMALIILGNQLEGNQQFKALNIELRHTKDSGKIDYFRS